MLPWARLGGLALLTGGLTNLLPGPPVLDRAAREALDKAIPSGAAYHGPPRVEFAVLPVQVWGLRYALDLVLISRHPDWTMHEYARIDLPEGPLWMAKDADVEGRQTITADIPDIANWVPEVPAPRVRAPLTVEDRSTAERVLVRLAYRNPGGQQVELDWDGPLPTRPSRPRNGNTMGHSRDVVAAILDLHLFRHGAEVDLRFDGATVGIERVYGLYPMKIALAQTQGGFAVADFRQSAAPAGSELVRPSAEGVAWPTRARETWVEGDGWARREGPVTRLAYHFTGGELDEARVEQAGVDGPVFAVRFQPALPDVRRPFPGRHESRFACDVGGQPGHGVGVARAWWVDADHVRVELRPEAPRWFAVRPIDVDIHYTPEGVVVRAVRVEPGAGG